MAEHGFTQSTASFGCVDRISEINSPYEVREHLMCFMTKCLSYLEAMLMQYYHFCHCQLQFVHFLPVFLNCFTANWLQNTGGMTTAHFLSSEIHIYLVKELEIGDLEMKQLLS